MQIISLIVHRIILLAITLLAVSVLIFLIINVLPGDAAISIAGEGATQAQIDATRIALGLDQPLFARYLSWIGNVVQGDLGRSMAFDVPVSSMLGMRLGNSALLASMALLVAVPLSIALGTLAAVNRGTWIDSVVTGYVALVISLPEYVIAVLAILVFSVWWQLLPGSALMDAGISVISQPGVLILPVCVVAVGLSAYLTQVTRASMLSALGSAYVRTAVLKGIPRRRIVVNHALRNALLPTVVAVGLNFGYTLGGLVVVETVFSYPGLGQLLILSVDHRDVTTLQAAVLLIAAAFGIGSLVADVASILLNPRLRS